MPEKLKGQLLSRHDVNRSLFLSHASTSVPEAGGDSAARCQPDAGFEKSGFEESLSLGSEKAASESLGEGRSSQEQYPTTGTRLGDQAKFSHPLPYSVLLLEL